MRTYITKSKSGHYTATIKDEHGCTVHKCEKCQDLTDARERADAAIKTMKVINRG